MCGECLKLQSLSYDGSPGFLICVIWLRVAMKCSGSVISNIVLLPISLRSAPAMQLLMLQGVTEKRGGVEHLPAKAFSLPVRTMARTDALKSKLFRASNSSLATFAHQVVNCWMQGGGRIKRAYLSAQSIERFGFVESDQCHTSWEGLHKDNLWLFWWFIACTNVCTHRCRSSSAMASCQVGLKHRKAAEGSSWERGHETRLKMVLREREREEEKPQPRTRRANPKSVVLLLLMKAQINNHHTSHHGCWDVSFDLQPLKPSVQTWCSHHLHH